MIFKNTQFKNFLTYFFRLLFFGLIIFEFLNLINILYVPLDFSWFGLIVTASFVWLTVELVVYFWKAKEYLPVALGLSFLGVLFDALGDIFHFYSRFGFYDRSIHLVIGAIIAYLLFILTKKYSPLFILGMTSLLGVLYEIEEYLEDKFIHHRGLRLGDGPDTADDLLMNLLGALLMIFIIFIFKKLFKNEEKLA